MRRTPAAPPPSLSADVWLHVATWLRYRDRCRLQRVDTACRQGMRAARPPRGPDVAFALHRHRRGRRHELRGTWSWSPSGWLLQVEEDAAATEHLQLTHTFWRPTQHTPLIMQTSARRAVVVYAAPADTRIHLSISGYRWTVVLDGDPATRQWIHRELSPRGA